MAATTNQIRNVALVGHGGAGKTTLVDTLLHIVGTVNRHGKVDDGSSNSDFTDEEKERKHSIYSTLLYAETKNAHINLIDTPGYPDFIGPALGALPGVESAVVVISASAGIEVNTRRMFQAAGERKLARAIVINKIDAENIDLPQILSSVQEIFGSTCRPLTLPTEGGKKVVNCFTETSGQSDLGSVEKAHTGLVESIVEADDQMMERYLGGEEFPPEKLLGPFASAMTAGTIIPVLFTDARNGVGIPELVTAIEDYFPSPLGGAEISATPEGEGAEAVTIAPNAEDAFRAFVFKVTSDPFVGKLSIFRVLSGKVANDTNFHINDARRTHKIGHLLRIQGKEHHELPEAVAGDIVGVAKLDELSFGTFMHDDGKALSLAMPRFPTPMFALAVEPKSRGDEQKISGALQKLDEEDQCFGVTHDQQTNETVIQGLGDLHLRVILDRLKSQFNLEVVTKQPKIAYRETITAKADGHYRHKKQTGGAGQFGEVYLRVEPLERGEGFDFVNDTFGGSIPGQFLPAVEKGVKDLLERGAVAGYPIQDIRVSVYDGKHHPVDSKEVAFRTAGKFAMRIAVLNAKPVLLEPVVDMEITIPTDFMGDITSDLSGRRGRIQGQDMLPGNMTVIKAQVPLAEVAQYNSQLKSVTGGQGSYAMELSHFDPVPPNVQQQIASAYKPKDEED